MLKEMTATAATIDEAKNKALQMLAAPADADVKIEVLEMPQKKMFGLFGGKDAKVKASYEAPDPVVKPAPAPAKPQKKEPPKAQPKPEMKAAPKPQEKKEAPKAEPKQPVVTGEIIENSEIKEYVSTIIKGLGVDEFTVTMSAEGEETLIDIRTEQEYGQLIGRHGDTLDAMQYLVRLFANKHCPEHKRITINIGDYREKRNDQLRAIAKKNANNVLKYGRSAKLDPMNPYERRIVHTAIQGIEGVTSHSVGYDENRRVVITLEEGVTPTKQDRRRSGGGYGGGRRGGGRRDGGFNKQQPKADPSRQPVNDLGGVRYGKIEVAPKTEVPVEAPAAQEAPAAEE